MDEVIEAMARALYEDGDRAVPYDQLPETVRRYWRGRATAAYNAMREKMVPVVMMHEHNEHLTEFERYRRGAGCLTDGDKAAGWTETPLYPLPEIDNG